MPYLTPNPAPYFQDVFEAMESDAMAYEVRVRDEYMFDSRTLLIDSEGSFEDDLFHLVEVCADLGIIEPTPEKWCDSPQWYNGQCYDRADVEVFQ